MERGDRRSRLVFAELIARSAACAMSIPSANEPTCVVDVQV